MNSLISTLFAVAFSSAAPSIPASQSCAAHMLSHPGCSAEQSMRLTAQQRYRINNVRSQTQRSVASLTLQLRRTESQLARVQTPLLRHRLLRRKASLVSQINRAHALGAARVNAVLSPWQRSRCFVQPAYTRPQARRPVPYARPQAKKAKQPLKPNPYVQRTARRAPPWSPAKVVVAPAKSHGVKKHKPAPKAKPMSNKGKKGRYARRATRQMGGVAFYQRG